MSKCIICGTTEEISDDEDLCYFCWKNNSTEADCEEVNQVINDFED